MRLFAAILFSDEVRQTLVLAIDLLKQQYGTEVLHALKICM